MTSDPSASSVRIGLKTFLVAIIILLALMITSGVLTRVLPAGSFVRTTVDDRELVIPGSFSFETNPDYPIWRWFTAPVELLFAEGSLPVITIIIFLLAVGGSITILESAGVMEDLVRRLVKRFVNRRYLLMATLMFVFMFLAAFLGVYEGLVPMIIFIVPIAHALGWDSLTGLGMSLLPMAFGFSAAVTNPFTIGVAQSIADLPLFSGAWLRIIFFLVVYLLAYWFVSRHARRVERNPKLSSVYEEDRRASRGSDEDGEPAERIESRHEATDPRLKRALVWFSSCMGLAIVFVLASSMISAIGDYAFPAMGILFLIGGIGGGLIAGNRLGKVISMFGIGCRNILPGVVLILMAYSAKHIIDAGGILDTILYYASELIAGTGPLAAAFLVYAVTLVMNFFVGSASAKAFLMMPLLAPLADLVGITRQTAVLAFDFGDGFSNMVFPTNALLIIALGFTVVSYPKWIRWTAPLQLIMLVVTSGFLAVAVAVGFGPF